MSKFCSFFIIYIYKIVICQAINYARSKPDMEQQTAISPPTSPIKTTLHTIEEGKPSSPHPTSNSPELDNEEKYITERKRTLTQRFSDYWRRRSRSHSKSASPEKVSSSLIHLVIVPI